MSKCPIKIDEPRYDQSTYVGRAKHFIETTNPLNVLVSSARLEEAKELVRRCRAGEPLPAGVTEAQLWRAKALFESAFHPDTGERMTLIGRMSAQVPMNMVITGGMVAFYRSTAAVVFWQWLNQSFNAIVNYTNRSGDQPQSDRQLAASYVCATGGAVGTALYLNSLVKRMPPLVGRFVPLVAVAAANCINIPMMRVNELREGTPVYDESNAKLGYSRAAARSGIVQVTFSRICMATPGMVVTPLVMSRLERGALLRRHPRLALPVTVAVMGVCLTFATPLACAFFQQRAAIRFDRLEPELQEAIKKNRPNVPVPDLVYFNKGL